MNRTFKTAEYPLLEISTLEDATAMLSRHIGHQPPRDAAQRPRRRQQTPLFSTTTDCPSGRQCRYEFVYHVYRFAVLHSAGLS